MIMKLQSKIKAKDHHIMMLETHMKNKLGFSLARLDDIRRYSAYFKEQKMYATMDVGKNQSMTSLHQSYMESSAPQFNPFSTFPFAATQDF